jgi:hypothetical protein
MPTDSDAERLRIVSAGGPQNFQEFRRLLSPRVRALKDFIRQTVACSSTFYASVAEGLNTIPDDYHDFLARSGWTIWMGDHLVNMDPSLKGQTPQGWPAGSTWAEVSGAYQHHRRRAMLAERTTDRNGTLHMARDVPATVREEIAHALDRALDQTVTSEGASSTETEFVAAYHADDAMLTDPVTRARLCYYLQTGAPGRREIFAQLFVIMGGVGLVSPHLDADLRAAFPNCLRVLPSILPSGTRGTP